MNENHTITFGGVSLGVVYPIFKFLFICVCVCVH